MPTAPTINEPSATTETTAVEVVNNPPQLLEVAQKNKLEQVTAEHLFSAYRPYFLEVNRLLEDAKRVEVTDATQVTLIRHARELRLKLRAQRIAADKEREALKENSLRQSNAIQGMFNVLRLMVEPVEEKLLAAEQFAERAEAARLKKLADDRAALMRPYADPSLFTQALETMDDAAFNRLLSGMKAEAEATAARLKKEAEEKAAREKAEAEERERIKAENERLKREAEERERIAAEERKKADEERAAERRRLEQERAEADARAKRAQAEHQAAEERARKQREEAEAKAREERRLADEKHEKEMAEIRRQNEERAAKERAEREKAEAARKKLERELREKRAAEEAERARKEQAEREAALAPDRDKILTIAAEILTLQSKIPQFETPPGVEFGRLLREQYATLAAWAKTKAEAL